MAVYFITFSFGSRSQVNMGKKPVKLVYHLYKDAALRKVLKVQASFCEFLNRQSPHAHQSSFYRTSVFLNMVTVNFFKNVTECISTFTARTWIRFSLKAFAKCFASWMP